MPVVPCVDGYMSIAICHVTHSFWPLTRSTTIFFGYSRRDSLTNILFNLGLPGFDTLLTNAAVTFARLWSFVLSYSYAFASALSVLCLIFTLLYSFRSVCLSVFFMFVCALMSLLLSVVYGPCCLNLKNEWMNEYTLTLTLSFIPHLRLSSRITE